MRVCPQSRGYVQFSWIYHKILLFPLPPYQNQISSLNNIFPAVTIIKRLVQHHLHIPCHKHFLLCPIAIAMTLLATQRHGQITSMKWNSGRTSFIILCTLGAHQMGINQSHWYMIPGVSVLPCKGMELSARHQDTVASCYTHYPVLAQMLRMQHYQKSGSNQQIKTSQVGISSALAYFPLSCSIRLCRWIYHSHLFPVLPSPICLLDHFNIGFSSGLPPILSHLMSQPVCLCDK